ncbi:MAG TPA: RNA-binding domain-containing protein [Tissierellales bacterium]|nr:RNA-binding domain-containing protein [Tissierellales bacterium]
MMKINHILEMINSGEGLNIEFKESRNKLNKDVFDSVCAFLNRNGGH